MMLAYVLHGSQLVSSIDFFGANTANIVLFMVAGSIEKTQRIWLKNKETI